ncbi:MAG: AraC family transcriptional regulator [Eubacteriaceae bacterium]
MRGGERYLSCKNKEYILSKGDIVLFNPEDNHTCAGSGDEPLDYLGLNISKSKMLNLTEEIFDNQRLPHFTKTVISDQEIVSYFQTLHKNILKDSGEFENEELLLIMFELLINRYCAPLEEERGDCKKEIQDICEFLQNHYTESISLDDICKYAGFSKSSLLRGFTREKGMTPYRYLQTIRVDAAKKLLEKGFSTIETSMQTGFSDQSHFTKFFTMFIGLSPGVYRDIFKNKNEEGKHL